MATRTRSPRPAADLSPEVKWYLKTRGYVLPRWCRPAVRTPEPRDFPGAVFDPARVDRVIAALRCLRHTQGKWRGRPLVPDPWQVAYVIAPVFGWVAPDDDGTMVRIIRGLYVDVPRKNGKTTLSSGLALYLGFADGEPGAQVYAVAASKDQARKCFDPAALIVRNSPELRAAGVRPLRTRIIKDSDGSYFEVASSIGDLLHGTNPHGGIIDELHVHKSPDVVDAIESGTGARQQPLVVIITTADDGRQDTVYAIKRDYIDRLARGTIKNPRQYGVVFAASPEDDPLVESTWRRANPGYGVSPSKAFIEGEALKAKQSPATLANFLRLHLGIRTKQETKYIDLPVWDRNGSRLVDELKMAGRTVFGGLDLASTSDLCALCWDFPADDGSHDLLWRHWCPERAFDRINERTAGMAAVWRKNGLLTVTPGDVADYDYIRAQINRDREKFDVAAIGFDRWNASQLVNDLMADEAPMVQIGQGFASMSAPLKQIAHLLLEGTESKPRYRHGGNALIRWQVDNLAVSMDPAGNVKPDKRKSGDKIDGLSAAVDAMSVAITAEIPLESVYETRGPLVINGL